MPDANARRQQRHDTCLKTTYCESCTAKPGEECWTLVDPYERYVRPHIGGLHAARWEAWEGLDAVTRLGDVLDG